MKLISAIVGALLLTAGCASAQVPQTVRICNGTQPNCPLVGSGNPLPVSGSFSATIAGFAPAVTGTPISVTTGGVTGTLPAGTVVVAFNVGTTNFAYCKLGASSTTSDIPLAPNGGWFAYTVGVATQLTCITSTSTTTVNMVGGAGLPTGTGGGSGGSGGGGAITMASGAVSSGAYSSGSIASGAYASGSIASGAMVDLGAVADAASSAGGTGTLSAKLRLMTTQLGTINTTLGSPFQAGGSIGNTTFASTQSGAWNITNVSGTVSLPTGAATAANQATEIASLATIATNTGAAIPAGSATIGAVNFVSQYPVGATAITASATGTTGATTATLAGTSGKTTFICGYSIRANATAAATVTNTITGVITATLSSIMWVAPLASGIGVDEQIFSPCVPASATNTGIAIVSGAPGSGGTVSSKGWGYQL